jgi:predicted acyl esterase
VSFAQEALASPHADAPCWCAPSSLLCDLPAPPPTPPLTLTPPTPPLTLTPTPTPTPTMTPARRFPPVHIYSCWHDVFLSQAIKDYAALAPHQPACRLIVGAHDHWSCARPEHLSLILRVVLDCLQTHLPPVGGGAATPAAGSLRRAGCLPLRGFHGEGDAARPDAECTLPVQLCLLGSSRWVGYAAWPPPVTPTTLYLAHSHQLVSEPAPAAANPATAAAPLRYSYVYHPAEPTPAAGGPSFNPLNSGAADQRAIERRADVLVFSTAPLPSRLRLVGSVSLRLRLSASARSVDILGRLCLVTRRGSVNLCEGIISLVARPGEASIGGAAGRQVTLELGPVAADFEPGSQLRLHVASAAHPRWARNLCGDPDVAWAKRKSGAAACRVHVWADGSSALVLPREV